MKFFIALCICTAALGWYIGETEIDTKVPIRAAFNLGVVHYKAEEWDKAEYWFTMCKDRYPDLGSHIRPEGYCRYKAELYLDMMDQDKKERELVGTWRDRKTDI